MASVLAMFVAPFEFEKVRSGYAGLEMLLGLRFSRAVSAAFGVLLQGRRS